MPRLDALCLALPLLLVACGGDTKEDEDDNSDDFGWDDGGGEDGGGDDSASDDTGTTSDDGGSGDDGGTDDGGTDDGGSTDGGSGDEGSATGVDDGGGSDDPMPLEGDWSVLSSSVDADPCGLSTFQDPTSSVPSTMSIAHTGGLGFTITTPDADPSTCEMDAFDFSCSETSFSQSLSDFGLSGSLDFVSALSGTLDSSEAAFDGQTDMEVSCSGSDCYLLEFVGLAFPCALSIGMEVEHD